MTRSLVTALALVSGCTISYPEGRFRCTTDDECPRGMRCHVDGLCYFAVESIDATVDASGVDAATSDAGVDSGGDSDVNDSAAIDGGSSDAGTDATNDAGRDAAAPVGCSDGTMEQVFSSDVVGCDGAQTQCSAVSLCAAGWHLCDYADYASGGGTSLPSAPRWLAACIRRAGGNVTCPSVGVCGDSCVHADTAAAPSDWACGGAMVDTTGGMFEGVLSTGALTEMHRVGCPSAPCSWAENYATWGTAGAVCCRGADGASIELNGTQCLAALSSPSLVVGGDLTLELWVRPTAAWPSTAFLAGKYDAPANHRSYALAVQASGTQLALYVGTNGGAALAEAQVAVPAIPVDAWTHLAASMSGGSVRFFVNGAFVGSSTGDMGTMIPTAIAGGSADFTAGCILSGGALTSAFDGRIDELRIWSRARTDAEINGAFRTTIDGATANGLAAYYAFDGTFRDESGHGNDFTDMTSGTFTSDVPF